MQESFFRLPDNTGCPFLQGQKGSYAEAQEPLIVV